MKNSCRHLITLQDLSDDDIMQIMDRGVEFASDNSSYQNRLADKVIGIYFRKTSTRTRTGFSAAALRMGGKIITYGPDDLQENTGEATEDTVKVLSSMLDCFVARTSGSPAEMRTYASQQQMAVVNAMSADEHPTQALADLTTLKQQFNSLSNLRILYIGEGNNTASALTLALSRFKGVELFLFCPPGYSVDNRFISLSEQYTKNSGAKVYEFSNFEDLPSEVDVVYTTRWETTGSSKADPLWKEVFKPYSVTEDLMNKYPNAIFMHDLPAHRGEEVQPEVIDGPKSIVFKQAESKYYGAMAALDWCLNV
ncbi:ornithine carbamoyltransferase [Bacillus sp. WMMC1349]|uniref:ornithine carbamoyltransferase n=1 Tax=Bacillus sp. WMMC1349 TaxID=2736254 RepID=UPI001552F026|nr:ornithine carbamoyltransferase [Bacillus sp. WMMC1349]NPC92943.1 ornithine carbamoyltransferase [Bacillus sp. WMMC1349]